MSYTPYLKNDEYTGNIPQEEVESYLVKASRQIDSMTFNRIVGKVDKLTEFQSTIIKEVCLKLAEFLYENKEMLGSVLKSYSINGVTSEFGGLNLMKTNGIVIPCELYQTLSQTGLCCRQIGRYL